MTIPIDAVSSMYSAAIQVSRQERHSYGIILRATDGQLVLVRHTASRPMVNLLYHNFMANKTGDYAEARACVALLSPRERHILDHQTNIIDYTRRCFPHHEARIEALRRGYRRLRDAIEDVVSEGSVDEHRWSTPTGGPEEGETVIETITREVIEETGLAPSQYTIHDSPPLDITTEATNGYRFIAHYFLADLSDDGIVFPQVNESANDTMPMIGTPHEIDKVAVAPLSMLKHLLPVDMAPSMIDFLEADE